MWGATTLLLPACLLMAAAPLANSHRLDLSNLQEKTVGAIQDLTNVLDDLKESLLSATTENGHSLPDGEVGPGNLTAAVQELVEALQSNTRALDAAYHARLPECPPPFWSSGVAEEGAEEECFYVNARRVSWSEARVFCQGLGGDLAHPTNLHALRASLLLKYPEAPYQFFWVGASETGGTEGQWRWLSGERVGAAQWAQGQPDGGNENCVVLSRDEHPPLHDSPCYTHTMFICQHLAQQEADDEVEQPPQ